MHKPGHDLSNPCRRRSADRRASNVQLMPAIMGNRRSSEVNFEKLKSAGQQNAHRAFPQVGDAQSPAIGLVARGGVEPPTFRFSVRVRTCRLGSASDRRRHLRQVTAHLCCRWLLARSTGCQRVREQTVSSRAQPCRVLRDRC